MEALERDMSWSKWRQEKKNTCPSLNPPRVDFERIEGCGGLCDDTYIRLVSGDGGDAEREGRCVQCAAHTLELGLAQVQKVACANGVRGDAEA